MGTELKETIEKYLELYRDPFGHLDLDAIEAVAILNALNHFNGNRTHASRALGISLRTMKNKIQKYQAWCLPIPKPTQGVAREVPAVS